MGKQKSEMYTYKDAKTNRKITALTSPEYNNYHLYFTDNSFTVGDNEIYFLSDRYSKRPDIYNIFRMDLSSGEITQVSYEENGVNIHYHTKTPMSDIVVYSTGNLLKKLDTINGLSETIYEEKPGVLMSAPYISHDKKYVGFPRNEDVNIIGGANYNGFKELYYAVKKSYLTLVYLDGSKAVDVFEDTHWISHFQFSPLDSTIASFCHEGPWNLVSQRIWILDTVSRKASPCFRQQEDDSIGHEFWTRDGLIFFDNRGRGHDGTITSNKVQATIAASDSTNTSYVAFADKNGSILRKIDMPFYCNHYHANNDNTLLVGDEVDDIVLIDISADHPKMSTLCEHNTSWYTQRSHCHPTFSWDGTKILYTSDKQGKCGLYLIDLNDQIKDQGDN